jgi:hypothetical protein
MSEQHAGLAATVTAVEAAFDGRWGIWRSDTGWWWATRTDVLTAGELAAGCAPFIHADNPDELSERICQQDERLPAAARKHGGAPQDVMSGV